MEKDTIIRYQRLIEARLLALKVEAQANADARNIVMLDQQSVGRLSRMDAIQQQSMANATQARREVETRQLNAALQRLAEGEFGYCEICGEHIPEARLSISPTATTCVSCTHS